MHSSATVAPRSRSSVTRTRNLPAEGSPLAVAIESVMEQEASLSDEIAIERIVIRESIVRHQEKLRRRDALLALAAELEARYALQPRRARRAGGAA